MFPCGAFVNVNKPVGPTSRAVVNHVAKLVKKSLKVGHTGTLDPFASGNVIIALGCATKLIQYLPEEKVYRARVLFGASTDTDDHTGRVLDVRPAASVRRGDVEGHLQTFVGDPFLQKPPLFSALHMGGERAYHMAREGRLALEDIAERPVRIHSCDLVDWPDVDSTVAEVQKNDAWFVAGGGQRMLNRGGDMATGPRDPAIYDLIRSGDIQEAVLDISCGRGTYIRSIARDLGYALGVPACLIGLERRESDGFCMADSVRLEDLESESALWQHAEPMDAVFARMGLSSVELPAALQLPEQPGSSTGSSSRGDPRVVSRTLERLWVSKKPPKTTPRAGAPVPPPVLGLSDRRSQAGSLVRVYASVAGWDASAWADRRRAELHRHVRRAVREAVDALAAREAAEAAARNAHTRQKRAIAEDALQGVLREEEAIEEALVAAWDVADPILDSRGRFEEVGRWTGVPPASSTQRQFVGLARVVERDATMEVDADADKEWLQSLMAACEIGFESSDDNGLCAEPLPTMRRTGELVALWPEVPLSVAAIPEENAFVRHLTKNVVRGMKRRASEAARALVAEAKHRTQASREEAKMRKRERMQEDKRERLAQKEQRAKGEKTDESHDTER